MIKNGGYRLGKALGRVGFAEVFEASHPDRPTITFAFKRPRSVPLAQERMAREVSVQRILDHPNVMPIVEAAPDSSWFVMPIALGNLQDLRGAPRMAGEGQAGVVDLAAQVVAGLQAAHTVGYIHRDITPRNILAFEDEDQPFGIRWVLSDWGMVKRSEGETASRYTETGEGAGTAGYAAPETWDDAHHVGPSVDIYSLGRVIAWYLTGRRPIPNVQLLPDGDLRGFVAECTEADVARRVPDVGRFLARLDHYGKPRRLSARAEIAEIVGSAASVAVHQADLLRLARQEAGSAEVYLDELTGLSSSQVRELARQFPSEMSDLATRMLHHLVNADWGRRSFDQANQPLAWARSVLDSVFASVPDVAYEDLAASYFSAERDWDRWPELDSVTSWLEAMPEQTGVVIARAIRRSGVSDRYVDRVRGYRVRSRTLSAELGL